ncbi:DUF4453 domain-containing protein [Gymnodinialimonas sp.]
MHRLFLILALVLAASPAAAQNSAFCQELWLSRNTVMDQAGQCFQTPLGQAVFDNSDCVPGDIRLNPLDAEIVRMAREMEVWAECRVDTNAERLDEGALPFRARLMELLNVPVRGDSEHGCGGYNGLAIALHAGMSNSTTVLGMLEPGQGFSLAHQRMRGGWEYLEVSASDGAPVAHGWTQDAPVNMGDACDFFAG